MALVIEDGTGVTGADSFATIAELQTTVTSYFAETQSGTDAIKEAALRRAFIFMKSLEWKSDYPFPTIGGTIPAEVKTAQAIFARYEAANPEGLQPSVIAGQQKVLTQVGSIGWTPTGQTGVDAQKASVTMAMDLIKDYLNGNGNTKFLDRA